MRCYARRYVYTACSLVLTFSIIYAGLPPSLKQAQARQTSAEYPAQRRGAQPEVSDGPLSFNLAEADSLPAQARERETDADGLVAAAQNSIGFSTFSYSVDEGAGSATVNVSRYGDTSGTASVDYTTSDGTAQQRGKYTPATGTLTFAPGQTSQSFKVLIIDGTYAEGNQTVNLTLNNPVDATLANPSSALLTISDNDAGKPVTNPIDDARFFVQQHYYDFLNRYPDAGGWDYWTDQITQCGTDESCINSHRIGVSAAYFIEQEFQQTGYVVYRLYRAAYGTLPNAQTRANVLYSQFVPDRAQLVGGPQLQQSTANFASKFVARAQFKSAYPDSMSPTDFVNKLFNTASLSPFTNERAQAISALQNGSKTRAQVLIDVIGLQAFQDREYNPAFVLMQYFGYLRRDPDQGGYDFWLNVLNNREPNNYRGMVCAFITSAEYQFRFSSVVTRDDHVCSNSPPHLDSLSATTAAPLRLLTLIGSGFDAANDLSVRFFDAQGYSVEVPVVEAGANSLVVPVPPYINPQTGAFGSGIVTVQAVQKSGTNTSLTNAVAGFRIQDLPTVQSLPGATTLSLLKASLNVAQTLQTDIKGTPLDTPEMNSALANQITNLQSLIPNVQAVVQNPTQTFNLGSYNGQPINIRNADLRNVDRLIVAMLQSAAANGVPSLANINLFAPNSLADGCDSAESAAFAQNAQQAGSNADIPGAQEFVYAPRQAALCRTPDAFNTAYKVAGGSAGIGIGLILLGAGTAATAAVALPSGALLYVTLALAGGMIGLGGARAQTSPGAQALVKSGIEKIEELKFAPLKALLPNWAGGLAAIGLGARSFIQGLNSAPVSPSGFSISPTSVNATISCVLNPPPSSSNTFTIFAGTVSVLAPANVSWTANNLTPPEPGASVTLSPSSGTGPMSVNVIVSYPHKLCTCPCSLSWNSGPIIRFTQTGGTASSVLSIAVDSSSCVCSIAPPGTQNCSLMSLQ